ncbi:hypothetical protein BHE74_00014374, partial [Ensete ventricosum]
IIIIIINISETSGEKATGHKKRKPAAHSRSPSGRRIPSRQSSRPPLLFEFFTVCDLSFVLSRVQTVERPDFVITLT